MQFYYMDETGNQQGPVSLEQLKQAGCKPSTLVWREGMADWQTARQVPELAGMFPPVPPTAPLAQPVDRYADIEPQPKETNKKLVAALVAVAACAITAAVVFFVMRGSSDDTPAMTDSTATDSATVEMPQFVAELTTTDKTAKAYFIANQSNDDSEQMDGEGESTYYLTKEYTIEWPDVANFDTEALQSAINYAMFKARVPQLEKAATSFLTKGGMAEGEGFDFVLNRGSKKESTSDDGYMYNWSHTKYCSRVTEPMPKNVVAFATGGYDYQGGAHGTPYQTGVVNYDCEQGHVIAYGDIFVPGCDGKILSLLKAARKKMAEYEPDMPVTRIPKDVMTMGANGVTFAYSVYELGSFAEGEVELTLPLAQIEQYLTEYGKELFAR